MASVEEFEAAVKSVEALKSRPDTHSLLELYGLYKQSTAGDVSGKRPGMLDVKGRKKYDAWSEFSGTSAEDARSKYVAKVRSLGA